MAQDDNGIKIGSEDDYSKALTTMKDSNKRFGNDIAGLQNKLTELNKTKTTLKVDTDKAKNALDAAEKNFNKTRNSANQLKLELASAKYETARRNLSLVSDSVNETEKSMAHLTNTLSKSESRVKSAKSLLNGAVESYASAGVEAFVGGTINMATTYAGSAFGSEGGTITNNVLSMGAMGAAIGTSIAPGIGTAIGALGGALFGYFQAKTQIFESEDKAFKSYYEDMYNNVLKSQEKSLANGSVTAASRETDELPFSTILGGTDKADNFLGSLTDFAKKTPYNYDELTSISRNLLSNGYKQEDILPLLQNVGDAGAALGMSKKDISDVTMAIAQLQTAGAVTTEELDSLSDRGIDVWSYMAEAFGSAKDNIEKSKEEVKKMVSEGLIPGQEAAEKIADALGTEFSGNMDKQAHTYSGLSENLKESQDDLDSAMGEGYNSTREGGMQKQIDWLSGDSGAEMKEAYNQIGQWKASLENLSEQYQRDAINSVMTGTIANSYEGSGQSGALARLAEEYKNAKADFDKYTKLGDKENAQKSGAIMGRVISEAQAIGTNEYNASDDAQIALDSNMALAENIKNDSASQEEYWKAGYDMGEQFTLGLKSRVDEGIVFNTQTVVNGSAITYSNGNSTSSSPKFGKYDGPVSVNGTSYSSNAYGLSYVPYNNYPALLHEGERVLTASENRSLKTTNPITITGNNFNIRKESDITKTAQEIAKLINQAYALAP